jgi:general nucleoside transport system ATP-binding protein
MAVPVIEMKGISKSFPGVVANDNVSIAIQKGEIHALLGENGAGKSTLMNILAGLYRPDSGELLLDGEAVELHSPADAIHHGIGMIHQHFKLVEAFTVAENIALGDGNTPFLLNRKKLNEKVSAVAANYGMEVDPAAFIWQLSVGEQQRVEILKALYRNARILILDEPTAVLTPQESAGLFVALKEMAAKGCTVIIITHKLAEVCDVAERVTVLRRGRVAGDAQGEDINYARLTTMMVGEDLKVDGRIEAGQPGSVVLKAEGLCVKGEKNLRAVDNISFELRSGEILGVAGVAGNGQRELAEALAGMRSKESGRIELAGQDISSAGARNIINSGLAFIPEDRLVTGLVGGMNMADNIILRSYWQESAGKGAFIDYNAIQPAVAEAVKNYDIAVADVNAPVRLMSGGNLQKLLLAREIALKPKAIIAAYPVRGLDIGATEMIYSLLVSERNRNAGVLFISEDLDALLKYSDRIMVLYRGRIMGIMPRAEAKLGRLGMMMMGTTPEEVMRYEALSHF